MRISDWSSDVCSSDLIGVDAARVPVPGRPAVLVDLAHQLAVARRHQPGRHGIMEIGDRGLERRVIEAGIEQVAAAAPRSEEHTSELQSLMRISYAVFCLKKKKARLIKERYRTVHTA